MKLTLIRHGKTEANEKHLYCGFTDIPLSLTGKKELQTLKNSAAYPALLQSDTAVITSGMLRCEETLAILYGDLPHTINPAFKEMNFGKFEMYSYEKLKTNADYRNWITDDNEANLTPGGESGNLMKERVITALEKLIEANTDTLLITHGGVIAAIMDHLFPEEAKNRYEWQPGYGGGYRIDLDTRTYSQI